MTTTLTTLAAECATDTTTWPDAVVYIALLVAVAYVIGKIVG